MRFSQCFLTLVGCFLFPVPSGAQELPLDSLLRANRYDLIIEEGTFSGEGLGFLLEASRDVQFFAIAEEHNLLELNRFSSVLFRTLHEAYGFNFLVLEQGSIIGSWMGQNELRGDLSAISELVARYPHAPTFATDQELDLIASVGSVSSALVGPIWGVDQEFGALHILERLADVAPSAEAREEALRLAAEAREYENDRASEVHYLAEIARPGDFETLSRLFESEEGDEAVELVAALLRTVRIYHNLRQAQAGLPTAYESGREREESMKSRFMERYGEAKRTGDFLPRVVAKLGHWHIFRGIYRANVPTFGNFLSEFSISNGLSTFVLTTYVVDSPESWRNSESAIAAAAGPGTYTLIDLRPLRALAHQKMITGLTEGATRVLFMADAALVIRGGRTGSYEMVKGG
jgi:hypothetical protein